MALELETRSSCKWEAGRKIRGSAETQKPTESQIHVLQCDTKLFIQVGLDLSCMQRRTSITEMKETALDDEVCAGG